LDIFFIIVTTVTHETTQETDEEGKEPAYAGAKGLLFMLLHRRFLFRRFVATLMRRGLGAQVVVKIKIRKLKKKEIIDHAFGAFFFVSCFIFTITTWGLGPAFGQWSWKM
jgi:hypothetical protein